MLGSESKKNHDTLPSPCQIDLCEGANVTFASTLFPQTKNAPVLDIQKLIKTFYKAAFV